jgi:hypothetical protein
MTKHLWVVIALVACSKSHGGDVCQQLTDKVAPVVRELATQAGKPLTDSDLAKMTDQCRERAKGGTPDDADSKCILAAKDQAAVRACMEAGLKDYMKKSKAIEAKLLLNKLGKNAKVAVIDNGAFPTGNAGPTPAQPCCSAPDHKCPVSQDWTSSPVWKALAFTVDEPTQYQFTYSASDGKSFTATAVGDPQCDGHPETYKLEGKLDASGNPSVNLIAP